MIVRMQGAGQYRLSDQAVVGLNALDSELLQAIQKKDEQQVTGVLDKMLGYVQANGQPLGYDEVVPSDVILPPGDLSYSEIVSMLQEDGLVPG